VTLLVGLLVWLLLVALIANIVRRLPWLPGLVVAVGLGLALWYLWRAPLVGEVELLGRTIDLARSNSFLGFTLVLSPVGRGAVFILFIWGALFALAATWTNADRVLFPTIPLILAALVLALSSQPLLWASLWLVVAVILMAFAAQGATPRLARAALRTLLAPTLAFPLFLFAAWVLNQPALAATDPALWATAWRALVIALVILLTPVPLHGWISGLGEIAPPFAAAFIVGVWQITVYALARQILLAYPDMVQYADPGRLLPILAIIQMVWAGFFGLSSRRLGQFWGYLLLWDYGAFLLLWSLSGESGTEALVWLALARALVLIMAAAGLQTLNERFGENTPYGSLRGASERLPFATIGFLVGALSLLGWPLGALFSVRLAAFRLAETNQTNIFLWAMLALVLMTLGIVRVLSVMVRPLADTQMPREAQALVWLVVLLLLAGAALALRPGLLDPVVVPITSWMTRM
jgi:formate hydrogenlyase subunit 3/multisubunit Na+/H+ antiporter MnhD subunit